MHVLKLSSYVLSVSMLALAPIDSAKAQRHGQYGQSQYGQAYAQQKVETIFANQYLSGREKINISRLLNLAPGESLESLKVSASSSAYDAKLVMKVNNKKVDAVKVDYFTTEKTLQMPSMSSASDKVVITANKGTIYVGKIEATISTAYGQAPGQANVLKARMNEVVRGHSIIKVLQKVKSQNQVKLRGLEVKKVVLKAQSLGRRSATAQLLVNGMPIGAPELITQGKIAFKLPYYGAQTIGREIKSLQIAVTGKAEIKMVGIKVKDSQTPQYPQVVTSRVNRTFYGSERVSLAQLLGQTQIPMGAKVESVTIVAEGKGKIMLTGAGMVMGDMDFDYYSRRAQTVQTPMGTSAASIKLRMRGTLTVKSVEIKLTR